MNLMETLGKASPSDFPALFFLQSILPEVNTIFDFGGSVGNLFYCYSQYLDFPTHLRWLVYDLPKNVELGEEIASHRSEHRLSFTSSLNDGDGADLLLATGAIHYFEEPLSEKLASFHKKPRYVLINRIL